MSVLQWHEITPQNASRVGELAVGLGALAGIGIPLVPGFVLTHEFLSQALERAGLTAAFLETVRGADENWAAAVAKIRQMLLTLQLSEEHAALVQKSLRALPEGTLHLTPSPTSGLPVLPTLIEASAAPHGDLPKLIAALWAGLWEVEFLQALRRNALDPFVACGGLIFQCQAAPLLRGMISTCNPESRNPFELILEAVPADSKDVKRWGSRYVLQRDPLNNHCRIKRVVSSHLDSAERTGTLAMLTTDQAKMLAHLALLAAERLRRPQRLHWTLESGRLQVLRTETEVSPTLYFPYKAATLELTDKEKEDHKISEAASSWTLSAQAPFSPLGMSLDHMFQQTLNQGILFHKLPLSTAVHRYVNGFRYQFIAPREASFLEKIAGAFRRKNLEEMTQEYAEKHGPKLHELLRALESQDIKDKPLKDQRDLLERTLRILLRYLADVSEIRCQILLQQRDHPRISLKAFNAFHSLAKRFEVAGLRTELLNFRQWDQLAPHILSRTEGEGLFQEVRKLQMDYGYLWLDGDPLDPAAKDDPALMLFFLRQALLAEEPFAAQEQTEGLSLADIDEPLFRGVAIFRKALQQTGQTMKASHIFQSADDVFYVTYEELNNLTNLTSLHLDYQRMLGALILDRKRTFATWRHLSAPFRLPAGTPHEPFPLTYAGKAIGAGKVAGTAEGLARLAGRSADLPRLDAGEILLTPFLQESWLPFLHHAAGILTDQDELTPGLAHGLALLGKPCLFGLGDASRLVRDGGAVAIDGEKALLKILRAT